MRYPSLEARLVKNHVGIDRLMLLQDLDNLSIIDPSGDLIVKVTEYDY